MVAFTWLIISFFAALAHAGDGVVECSAHALAFEREEALFAEVTAALSSAPECISSASIGKGDPESRLRALMKDLSDQEVFARLILAETLASTCPSADVSRGIAWSLRDRVEARNSKSFGLGREVVFKKQQFRSSTGSCDVAMREVFLCPSSAGASWKSRWKDATEAYAETQRRDAKSPFKSKAYHYFFPRHFDQSVNCAKWKGVTPAWASSARELKPKGLEIKSSCVGFYR